MKLLKYLICICCIFCATIIMYSQSYNTRRFRECKYENNIKCGRILVDYFGKELVESWLYSDFSLKMLLQLDSTGNAFRLMYTNVYEKGSRRCEIENTIMEDSVKILEMTNQQNICLDLGDSWEHIIQRLKCCNDDYWIYAPLMFPGELKPDGDTIVDVQHIMKLIVPEMEFAQKSDSASCNYDKNQH